MGTVVSKPFESKPLNINMSQINKQFERVVSNWFDHCTKHLLCYRLCLHQRLQPWALLGGDPILTRDVDFGPFFVDSKQSGFQASDGITCTVPQQLEHERHGFGHCVRYRSSPFRIGA